MLGKFCVDLVLHTLHQIAAAGAGARNGFLQRRIAPGVQMLERQILQLAVSLVQAQAVRDRCINFQRLGRDTPPLAARHIAHGAHIVGAVRQLDEDDAHIARHGQQHFAEGLGLAFFAGVELDFV